MSEVILSKRLQALADMVTPGRRVADVGCDHGFVSIYLVQKGISPKVLAMDVRTGPLSRAQEHISEHGLEAYIETRLSDGLKAYRPGEADALICAGMGGRLMSGILTDSRDKARGLQELILQPQSELPEFRSFLKQEGYVLLDENIVYEEGKYYFLMKVCFRGEAAAQEQAAVSETESRLYEKYGMLLLQRKHPVLQNYLKDSLENLSGIAKQLETNGKERAQNRLAELREEIGWLQRALDYMKAAE